MSVDSWTIVQLNIPGPGLAQWQWDVKQWSCYSTGGLFVYGVIRRQFTVRPLQTLWAIGCILEFQVKFERRVLLLRRRE